jgi:hypothetical protein
MTPEPASPQLTPQQRANQAHYSLAKAVRELLTMVCKDPEKFAPLVESEAAIVELMGGPLADRPA